MKIDVKTWDEYIGRLRRINKRAATEMEALLNRLKALPTLERREETIVDYAFKLATRYGEAAGAAACEMYDAIASASGRNVPPADPADTATFAETAKAIRGTIKNQSENAIPSTVGRLVKQVGADTMLKNAARDGAQFAWVPHGDTCPFCIMLASNGWQYVSKKTLRRGHAEHIHANCDCEYAVRFSEQDGVAGYDPDRYREIYDNADGNTWQEKLRSMQHDNYEAHKDERNARRRELYAQTKAINGKKRHVREYDVTRQYFENATPQSGNIDYEQGFNAKERPKELETAQLVFRQLGGDIVLKAEKQGQKNPDYEWVGSLWDLKSITSEKAANSAIHSGMKQIRSNPGGIILNLGDIDFSMDELRKAINLRMAWYPKECADIMIISKGRIIKILRY